MGWGPEVVKFFVPEGLSGFLLPQQAAGGAPGGQIQGHIQALQEDLTY